jgi:hypothetical protein
MEKGSIFNGHLEYLMFNGHLVILWSFGIFFHRFGIFYEEKSGNPAFSQR